MDQVILWNLTNLNLVSKHRRLEYLVKSWSIQMLFENMIVLFSFNVSNEKIDQVISAVLS